MRIKERLCLLLALASAVLVPQAAMAGWGTSPESGVHPTWVYTPGSTLKNSQSHGLLVVLHGCDQTNDQLKTSGNLETAAEDNGLVLAVPGVGNRPKGPGCWDYDGGADNSHHASEIVALTQDLMSRSALNIDRNQVYVVGLSSGAGLTLLLGCTAPDVFAGIGAIAGPSVGSSQNNAFNPVPSDNVSNATNKCNSLAGGKRSFLATQVANIAYGDMDKDGPNARFPYSFGDTSHPGQYALVSTNWSRDNIRVLQNIYGTDDLVAALDVQGGKGTEQNAAAKGQIRLSLLIIKEVGHAWPAGTGKPNSASSGGVWMAQQGLNYPGYATQWLLAHNLRANLPPEIKIVKSTVTGTSLEVDGTAQDHDPHDQVTDVSVKLDGRFPQPDRKASGTNPWSATFANLTTDACYTPVATAKDSFGAMTSVTGAPVKLGNPPSLPPTLTVDGVSLDSQQCINVLGTARSECSMMQKVEVELGNRGFEPAKLRLQNYAYQACGLPGGTYDVKVRAADSDGQTTLAAGGNVVIDDVLNVTAQFYQHVLESRIRMYAAPCLNAGYGVCDADVPAIISKYPSGPFALYSPGKSNDWYVDHDNAGRAGQLVRINVNLATAEDLNKLKGIGKVRAQAIIDNRPYSGAEELVSKHVIPPHVYDAIKDQIAAGQR